MKKVFFIGILLFSLQQCFACEICGCGVGNFYIGLLPNFKNKFFGIRYQYMHYHTQLANDKTQFSNDFYKTIELWSGFNINTKWQVLVFVPYQVNKQLSDDGLKNQNGLGDVSTLINYELLNVRSHSGNSNIQQQLWIGGGIKLPTGKYNADITSINATPADVNSQSGTGSTDFLLNAAYNLNINRVGLNTSVNYKINTKNKSQYQFGNRFTANTFAYYKTSVAGLGLAPNVGLLYENASANKLNKSTVSETGGNILLASGGLEVNFKRIAIGTNLQLPISQNFAEGQTQSKLRGLVHLTFAL